MTGSSVELTLLIPAYNEGESILANIAELEMWLSSNLAHIRKEILVVDDGSTDGMGEAVATYAVSHDLVRLVRHRINMGRGRAIRSGFEHARGDYIICLDADLSYAPDHIPRLLEPLRNDEADITLASAYHPHGQVTNVPWTRALPSRWGNRVLSRGVHGRFRTVTCMVRGYRRAVIDQIELINSGKDLHLEIIQKAGLFGFRIKEVPAHLMWRNRKRRAIAKERLIDRIPFLSMSGTIASHLIYSFVLRPGSLLFLPVLGLLIVSLIGAALLLAVWIENFVASPAPFSLALLYATFRQTLVQGTITLQLMTGSFLISLVFLAFYFASQQTKKNFEEIYILLNRMNRRIKQLERERKS